MVACAQKVQCTHTAPQPPPHHSPTATIIFARFRQGGMSMPRCMRLGPPAWPRTGFQPSNLLSWLTISIAARLLVLVALSHYCVAVNRSASVFNPFFQCLVEFTTVRSGRVPSGEPGHTVRVAGSQTVRRRQSTGTKSERRRGKKKRGGPKSPGLGWRQTHVGFEWQPHGGIWPGIVHVVAEPDLGKRFTKFVDLEFFGTV